MIGLAAVHLYASNLAFLRATPRSVWLSIGGGVSVAYVFMHLLPELSASQESIAQAAGDVVGFLEHHAYLIALSGLAIFYGVDKLALSSRRRNRRTGELDQTSTGVFWLHVASFALYNALIGYLLLHREQPGLGSLAVFFVAMALHFLVIDHGLREHHKTPYLTHGRYVLTAAIVAGWLIGLTVEVPQAYIDALFALLAGGIVLNVLKEELPDERQSRFWAFALGLFLYAALLMAL